MEDAAYALSEQHQNDLARFEASLTAALIAKGIPFVFIQPGDPGHKEARKAAMKHLLHGIGAVSEPIKPCEHLGITSGCASCAFKVKGAKDRLERWDP